MTVKNRSPSRGASVWCQRLGDLWSFTGEPARIVTLWGEILWYQSNALYQLHIAIMLATASFIEFLPVTVERPRRKMLTYGGLAQGAQFQPGTV